MNNNLPTIFTYGTQPVRTITKDGEPWFVAKDVCEVLDISKYRDAVARLDSDERGSLLVDTPGGLQEMAAVNEYGVYALIFTSRKPEARAFKRWITHEVIPAIRKTGTYSVVPEVNESLRRADAMYLNAKTRQANLMRQMAREFKDILAPESVSLLVAGATEILTGKSLLPKPQIDIHFTATEIAEEIGLSANAVGRVANKLGLKTTEYGKWVLDKSPHSDKQVKSFLYNQKGRLVIIEASGKKEVHHIITEEVNHCRVNDCGCGVNVATLDWVKQSCRSSLVIWKCLIQWEWLPGVVVPYNTDGKMRASRVQLVEKL